MNYAGAEIIVPSGFNLTRETRKKLLANAERIAKDIEKIVSGASVDIWRRTEKRRDDNALAKAQERIRALLIPYEVDNISEEQMGKLLNHQSFIKTFHLMDEPKREETPFLERPYPFTFYTNRDISSRLTSGLSGWIDITGSSRPRGEQETSLSWLSNALSDFVNDQAEAIFPAVEFDEAFASYCAHEEDVGQRAMGRPNDPLIKLTEGSVERLNRHRRNTNLGLDATSHLLMAILHRLDHFKKSRFIGPHVRFRGGHVAR